MSNLRYRKVSYLSKVVTNLVSSRTRFQRNSRFRDSSLNNQCYSVLCECIHVCACVHMCIWVHCIRMCVPICACMFAYLCWVPICMYMHPYVYEYMLKIMCIFFLKEHHIVYTFDTLFFKFNTLLCQYISFSPIFCAV